MHIQIWAEKRRQRAALGLHAPSASALAAARTPASGSGRRQHPVAHPLPSRTDLKTFLSTMSVVHSTITRRPRHHSRQTLPHSNTSGHEDDDHTHPLLYASHHHLHEPGVVGGEALTHRRSAPEVTVEYHDGDALPPGFDLYDEPLLEGDDGWEEAANAARLGHETPPHNGNSSSSRGSPVRGLSPGRSSSGVGAASGGDDTTATTTTDDDFRLFARDSRVHSSHAQQKPRVPTDERTREPVATTPELFGPFFITSETGARRMAVTQARQQRGLTAHMRPHMLGDTRPLGAITTPEQMAAKLAAIVPSEPIHALIAMDPSSSSAYIPPDSSESSSSSSSGVISSAAAGAVASVPASAVSSAVATPRQAAVNGEASRSSSSTPSYHGKATWADYEAIHARIQPIKHDRDVVDLPPPPPPPTVAAAAAAVAATATHTAAAAAPATPSTARRASVSAPGAGGSGVESARGAVMSSPSSQKTCSSTPSSSNKPTRASATPVRQIRPHSASASSSSPSPHRDSSHGRGGAAARRGSLAGSSTVTPGAAATAATNAAASSSSSPAAPPKLTRPQSALICRPPPAHSRPTYQAHPTQPFAMPPKPPPLPQSTHGTHSRRHSRSHSMSRSVARSSPTPGRSPAHSRTSSLSDELSLPAAAAATMAHAPASGSRPSSASHHHAASSTPSRPVVRAASAGTKRSHSNNPGMRHRPSSARSTHSSTHSMHGSEEATSVDLDHGGRARAMARAFETLHAVASAGDGIGIGDSSSQGGDGDSDAWSSVSASTSRQSPFQEQKARALRALEYMTFDGIGLPPPSVSRRGAARAHWLAQKEQQRLAHVHDPFLA